MYKRTTPGKRQRVPCTQLNTSDNSWLLGDGANGTLTDVLAQAMGINGIRCKAKRKQIFLLFFKNIYSKMF